MSTAGSHTPTRFSLPLAWRIWLILLIVWWASWWAFQRAPRPYAQLDTSVLHRLNEAFTTTAQDYRSLAAEDLISDEGRLVAASMGNREVRDQLGPLSIQLEALSGQLGGAQQASKRIRAELLLRSGERIAWAVMGLLLGMGLLTTFRRRARPEGHSPQPDPDSGGPAPEDDPP